MCWLVSLTKCFLAPGLQTTVEHISVMDSGVLCYITCARMRRDKRHLSKFYESFSFAIRKFVWKLSWTTFKTEQENGCQLFYLRFLGKSTSNPTIFLQYIISKAAISQFWMNKFVCQRSHCNLFELFYELCYSNWIQHSITVTPLLTVPPFPLPLYLPGLIIFAKYWVDVLSNVNCTSIYRCWSWVHSIINFSGISTRDTVAGAGSQINR